MTLTQTLILTLTYFGCSYIKGLIRGAITLPCLGPVNVTGYLSPKNLNDTYHSTLHSCPFFGPSSAPGIHLAQFEQFGLLAASG